MSGIRACVIDPFISASAYLVVRSVFPWETRDNAVGVTTSVASEAGVVIVACTVFAVRVVRTALDGEVVSVAIHVDLVSDEFARHWLDAGHLFHITFVSPGTCNDDATSVRTCSLALLGLRA